MECTLPSSSHMTSTPSDVCLRATIRSQRLHDGKLSVEVPPGWACGDAGQHAVSPAASVKGLARPTPSSGRVTIASESVATPGKRGRRATTSIGDFVMRLTGAYGGLMRSRSYVNSAEAQPFKSSTLQFGRHSAALPRTSAGSSQQQRRSWYERGGGRRRSACDRGDGGGAEEDQPQLSAAVLLARSAALLTEFLPLADAPCCVPSRVPRDSSHASPATAMPIAAAPRRVTSTARFSEAQPGLSPPPLPPPLLMASSLPPAPLVAPAPVSRPLSRPLPDRVQFLNPVCEPDTLADQLQARCLRGKFASLARAAAVRPPSFASHKSTTATVPPAMH